MTVVLKIAGEPIAFEEIWTFLLDRPEFLQEFAYARLLEQKLKAQPHLVPNSDDLGEYLNRFCQVNQLTDVNQFDQWLEVNNEDYDSFIDQISRYLALKNLRQQLISLEDVKSEFERRKDSFDRFVLSRIAFQDAEAAEIICEQIKQNQASFQEVFQEYSTSDCVGLQEWIKTFIRAELPLELQEALRAPQPGSLLEQPLLIGEWWYLVYVHKFMLASDDDLDHNLQEQISEALFEQQLVEKVSKQPIEVMEVTWSQLR